MANPVCFIVMCYLIVYLECDVFGQNITQTPDNTTDGTNANNTSVPSQTTELMPSTSVTTSSTTSTTSTAPTAPTLSTTTTTQTPAVSSTSFIKTSSTVTSRKTDFTTSSPRKETDSKLLYIVISVVGAVVIILIIILVIICMRRHKHAEEDNNEMQIGMVESKDGGHINAAFSGKGNKSKRLSELNTKPVPVDQFLKHVIKLMNTPDGFKHEFISLKVGPRSSVIVSKKEYNMEKNRFVNILAYDHTRVILDPDEKTEYVNIKNVKNDYINANYVNGYMKEMEFIASQGPLNTTIIDFWRLIWQNNVSKIVMVTNINERGKSKCAYYWPHEGTEMYGAIKVTLLKEEVFAEYIIRFMDMYKGKEKKTLLQFHFTAWPDEGAPTTGTSLLELQDLVSKTPSTTGGPILIHCSAGIGRTGTYIAVDYLKKQAAAENVIDVPGCVDRMREDRINMVQSLEQYVYIYTTVLEAVCCGKVRWNLHDFPSEFPLLTQSHFERQETIIDRHFKVLEALKPVNYDSRCVDAIDPANQNKNRSEDILPSDFVRPYLKVSRDMPSNYINAVLVDSLVRKSAYIVTQMPLSHTQNDLWRLITDCECRCILMLNEVRSDSEKDDSPYWPLTTEDEPLLCGSTVVRTIGISDTGNTVFTDLAISDGHLKSEKCIHHVWLRDWPDGELVPPSVRTLIDLYETLKEIKVLPTECPLLLHCLYGAEKSGLVCAVFSLLEAIEKNLSVDIFNAVKRIQRSRPAFISNPVQYRFLHTVAREFVEMKFPVNILL